MFRSTKSTLHLTQLLNQFNPYLFPCAQSDFPVPSVLACPPVPFSIPPHVSAFCQSFGPTGVHSDGFHPPPFLHSPCAIPFILLPPLLSCQLTSLHPMSLIQHLCLCPIPYPAVVCFIPSCHPNCPFCSSTLTNPSLSAVFFCLT